MNTLRLAISRVALSVLSLSSVTGCSARHDATAQGEVAQDDGELGRALAANPTLRDAVKSISAGHPWKATVAVLPVVHREPANFAATLVAARASAAWNGWPEVEALLTGKSWLDSSFDGEGRELLARAELVTNAPAAAVHDAEAAVSRATPSVRSQRLIYLARGLDRDNNPDSAAIVYRAASKALPLVSEWLALRAAGAERDSTNRAHDYSSVKSAVARSRIGWTEAQARERFGDLAGAAERFAALGARVTALRLRLGLASDSANRQPLKDSLIALLRGASRDDARQAVQVLDAASLSLTGRDEVAIGRALSGPGPLARSAVGFERGNRAGVLRPDDRLQYSLVLSRLGRSREALTQLDSIKEPVALAGQAAYQRARITMTSTGRAAAIPQLRMVADHFATDTSTASSALYLLADLLTDAGTDDSAIATYRELYHRYPAGPRADDARFRAAILDLAHGRARPAAVAFDSMLALFPRSTEHTAARYWAGRAWKTAGDATKAASDWQAVVAEQPSSYYGLASARRLNRAPWAPAPASGKLPALRFADSALARVAVLEQTGMDAEARFELESLEEHAKSRDSTLALATTLHDHGEEPRALRLAIKLIDQGDRDARTYRLAFPLVDRAELEAQSAAQGLDPALVAGLIKQESSFDPRAVSVANARGLMQLLPSVGAEIATALRYPVWSPVLLNDPDVNLQLGITHLAAAVKQYGDVTRALAAYNAGSSRVDRWSVKTSVDDPELFAEQIPFVETRDYVRIVQRNAQVYRVLYGMK